VRSQPTWSVRASACFALTKPRLAAMSILSTMTAYATARPGSGPLLATVIGTTLAAGGALSLNQWWERRTDAMMQRTQGRPLPQAMISPVEALAWSIILSLGGVVLLAAMVNATAAILAAATILIYGVIYTPLKRRTRWATEIGALSGALPALLGNAAAGDIGSRPGLVLTAVLLLWQMPHFFAIGWRHRADYQAAGFPLLPAIDPTGQRTARWSLGYSLGLVIVSLLPWVLGWLGLIYGLIATVSNVWFLRAASAFVSEVDRDRAARKLFFASIFYLPLVMGALIIDRLMAG
jgi:protoheme IX farnesyltransferase